MYILAKKPYIHRLTANTYFYLLPLGNMHCLPLSLTTMKHCKSCLGVFFVSIQSFPNPLINEIKSETFIGMLVIDKFVMFILMCTL